MNAGVHLISALSIQCGCWEPLHRRVDSSIAGTTIPAHRRRL